MAKKTFAIREIDLADLRALDLQEEAEETTGRAYSITIYDDQGENPEAETAEAFYCAENNRLGIAWGADATWADVESVEDAGTSILNGIEKWLSCLYEEEETR